MVIRKATAAATLVLLASCAIAPEQRNYQVLQTRVELTIQPNFKGKFKTEETNGRKIHAEADIGDGFCHIRLRKYPHCLLHEIRHCFEGDFHKGEDSDEDC